MSEKHIPKPLTSGHLCPDCKGTGADIARTLKMKDSDTGYIRCGTCNGNGLDPAAYFRWGNSKDSNEIAEIRRRAGIRENTSNDPSRDHVINALTDACEAALEYCAGQNESDPGLIKMLQTAIAKAAGTPRVEKPSMGFDAFRQEGGSFGQ